MPDAEKSETEILRLQVKKKRRKIKTFNKRIRREMYTYVPLLVVLFLFVIMSRDNGATIQYGRTIEHRFIDPALPGDFSGRHFDDLMNRKQVYHWLRDILVPEVFGDVRLEASPSDSHDAGSSAVRGMQRNGYVADFNKVLGGVRMYQKRVKVNNCEVNGKEWGTPPQECYYAMNEADQDKSDRPNLQVAEARRWQSASELGFNILPGYDPTYYSVYSGQTYQYGSYPVTLPVNKTIATSIINMLEADKWIDKQTRVVLVEMTLFNNYNQMHINVRFAFEWLMSGKLVPSYSITCFKLFSSDWLTLEGNVVFLLELTLYSYVLGNFSIVVYDIAVFGLYGWMIKQDILPDPHSSVGQETGPSQGFFEILDKLNLVLLFVLFVYRTIGLFNYEINNYDLHEVGVSYFNHTPIATYLHLQSNLWGINTLIAIFKLFKYLQIIPALNSLWKTVNLAMSNLIYFLAIFLVIQVMFTVTAIIWFGYGSYDWHTFFTAFTTIFRIMLGQIDYPEIARLNMYSALIFFAIFIIFVYLILLNMFLAIINNAYCIIMDDDMRDAISEHQLRDQGSNSSKAFMIRIERSCRLLWSSIAINNFRTVNEGDSLEEGVNEEDDSDEEEFLDEQMKKFNEDEVGFVGEGGRGWLFEVDPDLDPTKLLLDADEADIELHNQLKEEDRAVSKSEAKEISVIEKTEAQRAHEAEEAAIAEKEETRMVLENEFERLSEQVLLYMRLEKQLSPQWLADAFRKLENDAQTAGAEDIMNKANSQADLIEMTGYRSATGSRLFSLLSQNERMPEYAPYSS